MSTGDRRNCRGYVRSATLGEGIARLGRGAVSRSPFPVQDSFAAHGLRTDVPRESATRWILYVRAAAGGYQALRPRMWTEVTIGNF